MGEVVRLPAGRLTTSWMTAADVEVACLRTAADLMSAAASWGAWRSKGFKTDPMLAIAEALCVDLVRHNRRHLPEAEVCNSGRLLGFEMRLQRILEGVRILKVEIAGPDPAE